MLRGTDDGLVGQAFELHNTLFCDEQCLLTAAAVAEQQGAADDPASDGSGAVDWGMPDANVIDAARPCLVAVAPEIARLVAFHDTVFPGLNDCYAGLEWTVANLDKIGGTRQVIITGESGGGNLCLATALKAGKAGKKLVSGV